MPLLPKLNLSDVPVEKCKALNGLAILGELQVKETSNGVYVNVSVPLYYVATKDDPSNGVQATDYATLSGYGEPSSFDAAKSLGLSIFTARWNIKPEWFSRVFTSGLIGGHIDDKEKMMYQINVAGISRSLAKSLGEDEIDFDTIATRSGQIVGFKARPSKSEPDKNQISAFYYARRS